MNKLIGSIEQIKESGSLSMVSLKCTTFPLHVIIIDNSKTVDYLTIGNEIQVLFKETALILTKSEHPRLSIPNKIPGQISTISKGEVLSKVEIKSSAGNLVAIIPSVTLDSLALSIGNQVFAFVKTNEILLAN